MFTISKPDTYLVTKDIALTLEERYNQKLSPLQKQQIRGLENSFVKELWQYVPKDSKTVSTDAEDIQSRLSALISAEQLPVITLDDIYIPQSNPYVSGALSVTRLTDPKTKEIIGLGPRPGAAPLEDQIDLLKDYKSLCVVDIGAFEGDTALKIIKMLRSADINVERLYLGVWGKQAVNKVNGIVDTYALKTFDFYEWIELRDFFGIDGRKTTDGNFIPFWENPKEWASIPAENVNAVRSLCKGYNAKLNKLLGGAL